MRLDPSGWQTRLDDDVIARHTASGAWQNRTLAGILDALCGARPAQRVVVDGETVLSAQELQQRARHLAGVLTGRGVTKGEVVSFQLPNWHEAVLVELACAYGGFVCNPIVPIYRDAEVSFILADARTRVLFIAEQFRGFDYRAMVDRRRAEWPNLSDIVFVRPSDSTLVAFDHLEEESTAPNLPDVDPNDVKLIMYTSGTTSRAKGVLHTHNTIDTEIRNIVEFLSLDSSDVVLMPSPLSHITGYLYGIQLPVTLGCPVVLMDTWNVATAADLIDRHQVTFTLGATPFLQELGRFANDHNRPFPSLRYFPTGGAPVPPEVVRDAKRAFARASVFRLYGSTEAPTVTLGAPDPQELELAATTEGFVVGHEIRLISPDGKDVTIGREGEIITRGPEVCVGYAAPEQNAEAFDADGYFHTGDLACATVEGCIVVTGRKKDLIIRGGENISPKEIEDVLYTHPAVREAAVVAMPHARLGETCCAFVTVQTEHDFDFGTMLKLLEASGLAKQKYPERLEVVDSLPYTAAGKIRKNVLRKRLLESLAKEKSSNVGAAPETHSRGKRA